MSHKPQLFSGARGVIKYGKGTTFKTLAIAVDISVNTREQLRPTYVVGRIEPISIEPIGIDVDCSIGRIIPVNAFNALATGDELAAESTSRVTAIDISLEEKIADILTADSLTIEIYDSKATGGDNVISSIKDARFTGRSVSLNSSDVAQERLNFVGIYDGGYGGESNTPGSTAYGFETT